MNMLYLRNNPIPAFFWRRFTYISKRSAINKLILSYPELAEASIYKAFIEFPEKHKENNGASEEATEG